VLVKTDKEACGACISACAGIVALAAALLQPFMPSFTTKALGQLGLSEVRAGRVSVVYYAVCRSWRSACVPACDVSRVDASRRGTLKSGAYMGRYCNGVQGLALWVCSGCKWISVVWRAAAACARMYSYIETSIPCLCLCLGYVGFCPRPSVFAHAGAAADRRPHIPGSQPSHAGAARPPGGRRRAQAHLR